MSKLEHLALQTKCPLGLNFFALSKVNPTDTRPAIAWRADGSKIEFDAPASHCFSGWDGYWSNFRLADYAAAMFPGVTSAGYLTN